MFNVCASLSEIKNVLLSEKMLLCYLFTVSLAHQRIER